MESVSVSDYSVPELTTGLRDCVVNIVSISGSKRVFGNGFFVKGHFILCPLLLIFEKQDLKYEKVIATVSNVNGGGRAFSYELTLFAYDGAANIALSYIDMKKEWNSCNLSILSDRHSFLIWGKSRNLSAGGRVLLIGNVNYALKESNENAVKISMVSDNRYVCYDGNYAGELILLSDTLHKSVGGMPVIDMTGHVVGMTMYRSNLALSEYFMRPILKKLIKEFISLEKEIDKYLVYCKSSFGLYASVFTQEDYLGLPPCSREIVGYKIKHIYENSPLLPYVEIGDVVTEIRRCPLGDRKSQISPALIMWRLIPGEQVEVKYKKLSEGYFKLHEVSLKTIQYDLDFPYEGNGEKVITI